MCCQHSWLRMLLDIIPAKCGTSLFTLYRFHDSQHFLLTAFSISFSLLSLQRINSAQMVLRALRSYGFLAAVVQGC